MSEVTFSVFMDSIMVAESMTLETAIILAKGLFNEYYLEPNLKIIIQKVQHTEATK